GSFIESFPLFGNNLNDYDSLFSEKLDLLIALNKSERITWSGKHRATIDNRGVYARQFQEELPIWIAVGGTPESVIRAATKGLPMALAIIGGMPERFVPFADLYRETWRTSNLDSKKLGLAIHSHGYIADDSQKAGDEFY